MVQSYAGIGVRGFLLRIADTAEETLPFRGRVRFEGLEGEGGALVGRVEAVRDDYVAVMEIHKSAIANLARSVGWTSASHRTDNAPQSALLALYQALSENPKG